MSEVTAVPAKPAPRHRDWTQGPILKNLLLLSWPMMVMEAAYMVSQIFDMVWVGRSGSASLAAITIGGMIVMLLSTVDMGLISGARAMISRFMGAGDHDGARKVVAQIYILAVCWGALVTVAGYFTAPYMMNIFGVAPDVAEEGTRYLRVLFCGWLSLEVLVMGLYSIQSTGDSLNPMIVEIGIRTVHCILCPFLVLGLWIFPQMGIAGAALSNVISQLLGAIILLWFLFSGHTRLKLALKDFRFVPDITRRILKIGLPSLLSMIQSNFSMFVFTWIIVPFGTAAVAANGLVGNVHSFIITPNMGMGGAVAVLVGQNLGAKKPERAVKSTWLGAAVLEGFLILCSIIVLVFAEKIVGVFSTDPVVLEIGAAFLRITTAAYLVMGINSALMSCISGAGDTLPNMIINIGMIWILQIPLSYLLANYTSLDVYGIRWALVIAAFAGSIAYFAYFKFGRWKQKKV